MFWGKLNKLCVEKNTVPTRVATEIGMSKGVVTRWREGSIPSYANLLKLADYFGVPVDYFTEEGEGSVVRQTITGNNNIAIHGDNNTVGAQNEMEKALLSLFRSLSPIEQAYEITRLDGIVNKK